MVDMRFGPGTWKGILEERRKRIQEAKEAEIAARKQAQLKHDEMMEGLKSAFIISLVVAVAIGLFFFFMISVASAIGIA